VVRADIFTGSLAVFPKNAASPLAGEPQNHGGFSSPPQAAKNVRTIFKIVHQKICRQLSILRLGSPGHPTRRMSRMTGSIPARCTKKIAEAKNFLPLRFFYF